MEIKWSDAQLDLFCGIPRHNINTNAVVEKVEVDMLGVRHSVPEKPKGKNKGFVGNINETIGF